LIKKPRSRRRFTVGELFSGIIARTGDANSRGNFPRISPKPGGSESRGRSSTRKVRRSARIFPIEADWDDRNMLKLVTY